MELVGTQPLELWLERSQKAKESWSQKNNLLVPILHVQPIECSGTENLGLLQNVLLNMSRV